MMKVYCDHSATTPLAPEVFSAMEPYLVEQFGNPSSIHAYGRKSRSSVEKAREQIANVIGAETGEIVFTSGGTEADNFALMGAVSSLEAKGRHIITSQAEHPAILEACSHLEQLGFEVSYLPVNKYGMVSPGQVRSAIQPDTILISIMHASNEVGTINPIADIGLIAHENNIVFHSDAVQTFGKIPVNVRELHVDMMSLSAHKAYGPHGIGVLYIRTGLHINPLLFGGSQERNRRAGTENVPAIVGMGTAAELCEKRMADDTRKIETASQYLYKGIKKRIQGIALNGSETERLRSIVNLSFDGIESESIVLNLDLKGIAASSGSASSSGSIEPSHVLIAMGRSPEQAKSAVRFSLGRNNTIAECDYIIESLEKIVERLRSVLTPA